jgi:hypothetical protein
MKLIKIFTFLFIAITTFSCAHRVTRIDSSNTPDISGKWNNTDSRLTSEEMIQQCLNEKWLILKFLQINYNTKIMIAF